MKPIKQTLQINDMDDDLRNGLWNALTVCYWEQQSGSALIIKNRYENYTSRIYSLLKTLWHVYYKRPLDTLGIDWNKIYNFIREYFFSCPWYEVYDFIEFIPTYSVDQNINQEFIKLCNGILETEISAYRFVEGSICKITSEVEIESIEQAIKNSDIFTGVSIHLKTALKLLTDRKAPDYRNSIKESISAVESVCIILSGDTNASLGKALKIIESKLGIDLHPALKGAFEKLYGYTSDADGIRHALLEETNINFEDAKFMIVSCSAFVNYLINKNKD